MVSGWGLQSAVYADLPDKVSSLLRAFDELLSTLPETFILLNLPGLQLRNNGGFLLLLGKVLIESQRIVWLFLLVVPGTAVRPLDGFFGVRGRGGCGCRGGPVTTTTSSAPVSTAGCSTPVIATSAAGLPRFGGSNLFSSSVVGSSGLSRQFGLAFVATP